MASQPSVQTPMANETQTSEVNQENETSNYETINAPMVGTFINLHHPKEAYVQVGDKVTNDSTVCILEAII